MIAHVRAGGLGDFGRDLPCCEFPQARLHGKRAEVGGWAVFGDGQVNGLFSRVIHNGSVVNIHGHPLQADPGPSRCLPHTDNELRPVQRDFPSQPSARLTENAGQFHSRGGDTGFVQDRRRVADGLCRRIELVSAERFKAGEQNFCGHRFENTLAIYIEHVFDYWHEVEQSGKHIRDRARPAANVGLPQISTNAGLRGRDVP
ncbi:hypothetical protein GCM10027562_00740 [Arthrobacter pigmenti]